MARAAIVYTYCAMLNVSFVLFLSVKLARLSLSKEKQRGFHVLEKMSQTESAVNKAVQGL